MDSYPAEVGKVDRMRCWFLLQCQHGRMHTTWPRPTRDLRLRPGKHEKKISNSSPLRHIHHRGTAMTGTISKEARLELTS